MVRASMRQAKITDDSPEKDHLKKRNPAVFYAYSGETISPLLKSFDG